MGKNGAKTGFWIAIAVLAMMLCGSFVINIGLAASVFSGSPTSRSDYPEDEKPSYEETWSYGRADGAKVVRIDLSGIIMRGQRDQLFGYEPDMVEVILGQIRAATIDSNVKAILLEVNSPGGAVTPSDEIYSALKRFKEESEGRLVMVFIRDIGASGAYYAAMAGDYIMAEPTAIIGSVGVIMQTLNMKGLGDKIGLSSVTITSGDNKDMLNPFKEISPTHVKMLQELVDGMQERFASIVEDSRGLDSRVLLDGRIFSASQALENDFIDGIGYLQDATDKLALLLAVEDVYLIRYHKDRSFFKMLMSCKLPQVPNMASMESPRLLYQWKP